MNKNILRRLPAYSAILLGAAAYSLSGSAAAQEAQTTAVRTSVPMVELTPAKPLKAWEVGIGLHGMYLTRFGVIDFRTNDKAGYSIETSKKDALFGGELYLARELTPHLALDLQGILDYTKDPIRGGTQDRLLGMAGAGLQWRLGRYFGKGYIDPFLRAGVNYMYKNFTIHYNGLEEYEKKQLGWDLKNDYAKGNEDRNHLVPVSLGAGVNMWVNDKIGIGLQGDYLVMTHGNVPNTWQGAVRVMWRIGGSSFKPAPAVEYVERVVEKVIEKVIEKPVEITKIVEAPAKAQLSALFENVYFDFDKAEITERSYATLDDIATIMKTYSDKKYLIIGCTDAKGSQAYNQGLSERRAKAVVDALIERGVPAQILKHRGLGKAIAYAKPGSSNDIREGDRKILVEVITNNAYWETLR